LIVADLLSLKKPIITPGGVQKVSYGMIYEFGSLFQLNFGVSVVRPVWSYYIAYAIGILA